MKENFINKFLNKIKLTIYDQLINKIKLTINDQLIEDFARRFTTIKIIIFF